jgi:hypothetical protein
MGRHRPSREFHCESKPGDEREMPGYYQTSLPQSSRRSLPHDHWANGLNEKIQTSVPVLPPGVQRVYLTTI